VFVLQIRGVFLNTCELRIKKMTLVNTTRGFDFVAVIYSQSIIMNNVGLGLIPVLKLSGCNWYPIVS
jgi:hypothetical protein